jgi:hypothetical protein
MSTRSRVIIVGRYQIVLIDLSMNVTAFRQLRRLPSWQLG